MTEQIKYPTGTDPYITVPEADFEAGAPCGCRMVCAEGDDSPLDPEEGEIVLLQCSMHAAAPELLQALVHAVEYLPVTSPEHTAARSLIQRARGSTEKIESEEG